MMDAASASSQGLKTEINGNASFVTKEFGCHYPETNYKQRPGHELVIRNRWLAK